MVAGGLWLVWGSEELWALIFLGVAASGLAYLFWYGALGVADATEAGAFVYLELRWSPR